MIAFDSVSAGGGALPGNSITYPHTCSGAGRILIVAVSQNSGGTFGDFITSVTYGGVPMIRVDTVQSPSGATRSYLYYLLDPPLGTNNVVVSCNTSTNYIRSISASYTGVLAVDAHTRSSTDSTTSMTTTVTTTQDNCWNVSMITSDGALAFSAGAGVGAIRGVVSPTILYIGDTNAVKTPAGAQSMTWTSGAQGVSTIQLSMSPVAVKNVASLDFESSALQYAVAETNPSVQLSTLATFEAMVKFESLPTSGGRAGFIGKYVNSINQISYYFSLVNNGGVYSLELLLSPSGSTNEFVISDAWTPTLGVWYHVAVTYDGGTLQEKFYIDGAKYGATKTTTTASIFQSNAHFTLGGMNPDNAAGTVNNLYDGLLDEVKIWDLVRTQTQISSNMKVDVRGQTGLRGYWKLDNDYMDSSGNGTLLTPVNGPVFSSDISFTDYFKAGGALLSLV